MSTGSPFGLHRVLGSDTSVLPQQAWRLDPTPHLLSSDEVVIEVEALQDRKSTRLNSSHPV